VVLLQLLQAFPEPAACSTLGLVTCPAYVQEASQIAAMVELPRNDRGKTDGNCGMFEGSV
jgi:hypothetical protein